MSSPGVSRRIDPRRAAFVAVGFALSAAGLWYVFHDVDAAALLRSAERVRLLPLLGSLASYWAGLVLLRSVLVRHLLRSVGDVTLGQAYRYICIGFLANNVLPFRAGDVARSVAIHRGSGIRFPSVVGSLAVERMLDMMMVAAVGLAAIQVAPLPAGVRIAALISGGALGVALAVLTILARRSRAEKDEPGGRWRAGVWNLWVRFSAGFGALGTARGVLFALALAVLIWILALATMLFRLAAFDLEPSLPVVLALLASLGFGVAVPSAPGYVGTYHAAAAFALQLFGVESGLAAAYGLFSWIVDIGASSLAGGICLPIEGLRLAELRRGTRAAPSGEREG